MYDLEAVRRDFIGRTSSKRRAKYPVEHEPIRRHCIMVGNDNPLYIEPGYAPRTPCPPTALWIFSMVERLGPKGPRAARSSKVKPDEKASDSPFSLSMPMIGSQFTNMGRELEFLLPVYVGDHLSSATRTADIYLKPTRLDPESLWIVNEDIITNQNDEVVCLIRNTLMNFRTPDELKAAGVTQK
ncbi:MAG: MaoC family dehydratase N-terminal domain-containing protein [Alphaproteobacteria bacterium]